jgi:hypothetical protein
MQTNQVFRLQQVPMSDNSKLFEIVTQQGERIAAASTEAPLAELTLTLNTALGDAAAANSDVTLNVA